MCAYGHWREDLDLVPLTHVCNNPLHKLGGLDGTIKRQEVSVRMTSSTSKSIRGGESPLPTGPSPIILASTSPRRQALLARCGIRFSVQEPGTELQMPPGLSCDLGVQLIARQKALSVAEHSSANAFIIAADTIVVGPEGPLGKPHTPERAREMLKLLIGNRHTVLTGVCVATAHGETIELGVSRSAVKMRDVSDEDLDTYVASGEPLDKAGAYAVQEGGRDLVEAVMGRVDTVVGLDVELTLQLLLRVGYPNPLPASTDIALPPRGNARRPFASLQTSGTFRV